MTNEILYTTLIATFTSIFGAIIGCLLTLWLTTRKERKQAEIRFKNRLQCVASELPLNFQNVGNRDNPFQTLALKKLVYEEELIHKHPVLFQKAHECLCTALHLSSASNSKISPGQGQNQMKDLAEHFSNQFNVRPYKGPQEESP